MTDIFFAFFEVTVNMKFLNNQNNIHKSEETIGNSNISYHPALKNPSPNMKNDRAPMRKTTTKSDINQKKISFMFILLFLSNNSPSIIIRTGIKTPKTHSYVSANPVFPRFNTSTCNDSNSVTDLNLIKKFPGYDEISFIKRHNIQITETTITENL